MYLSFGRSTIFFWKVLNGLLKGTQWSFEKSCTNLWKAIYSSLKERIYVLLKGYVNIKDSLNVWFDGVNLLETSNYKYNKKWDIQSF